MQAKNESEAIWYSEGGNNFKLGQDVTLKLYHTQKEALLLQRPMEMTLEIEQKDGTWRKIRNPYCPCLMSCPPPPLEQEIQPNERFVFSWEPIEKWCEATLMQAPAPAGKYRLLLHYLGANNQNPRKEYHLFYIK